MQIIMLMATTVINFKLNALYFFVPIEIFVILKIMYLIKITKNVKLTNIFIISFNLEEDLKKGLFGSYVRTLFY